MEKVQADSLYITEHTGNHMACTVNVGENGEVSLEKRWAIPQEELKLPRDPTILVCFLML